MSLSKNSGTKPFPSFKFCKIDSQASPFYSTYLSSLKSTTNINANTLNSSNSDSDVSSDREKDGYRDNDLDSEATGDTDRDCSCICARVCGFEKKQDTCLEK